MSLYQRFALGVFTVVFVCMLTSTTHAQQTSRGRDFYFTYLPNYHNQGGNNDSLFIFVVADSATTGTLTFKNRSGQTFTQNINITNPTVIWKYQVHWDGYELVGYNQSGNFSTNNDNEKAATQTFRVTTDKNVAVYALNKAVMTSDASMILPTALLGTDYYVMAYRADGVTFGNQLDQAYTPSEFAVVATDSNTTITVTKTVPTTETGSAPVTVTLQKGESYLFQSEFSTTQLRYDLTGTHVTSNKPVAIFAGHQRATIPVNLRGTLISRDQLYEQMLPTSVWGRSYVITPLAQPQGISTIGTDLWRAVASEDGTVLNFNNVQVATLNRGQFYEASLNTAGLLVASKKVMVAFYKKTHSDNGNQTNVGDPFMMIIPPRRQYLNNYRYTNIQAMNSFLQQYITVVTTRNNIANIRYDGNPLTATFLDIPNTCFSYANINVTSAAHNITSPQPVGLYVYGYGNADSYGYVGGMALVPDVADVDIDAGPDRKICNGDSVHITVTGAASNVKWIPKTGLNCDTCRTVIARPTVTTAYIVSALDSLGCEGKDTVIVTVRNYIVDAGKDTTICAYADSVTLKVKGVNGTPVSVRWTPKNMVSCDTCISTKTNPHENTKYIVTAVDSLGCVGRDTIEVKMAPPITVEAGPDLEYCSSKDSLTLRVTAKGLKYVWWTPKTGLKCDTCATTRVRPTGIITYYVTVRDSAGCEGMDSVTIKPKSGTNSLSKSPDQSICFKNDSALIYVQGIVKSIIWTPSTGLKCDTCVMTTAKPTVTTTYKYKAIDAGGCDIEDSVRIYVLPKAVVNIDPDIDLCTSTGVLITATGDFQTIQWTPSTGLACNTCKQTLATPPKKDIVYYARVRNGNSADCDAVDSIKIKYAPGIEGQLSSKTICKGDSVDLNLVFGGKVKWSPKTYLGACDTCKNYVIKPTANIKYTVTGDSAGCTSTVTFEIKVSAPAPIVAPPDTSICRGESVILDATTVSTDSVHWTPEAGLDCPYCLKPKASPLKTTMYTIELLSSKCSIRQVDSVLVTVKDSPTATVNPVDTALCEGGVIQYVVSGQPTGSSIFWNPSTWLSCDNCPNPKATPSGKGNITYQIHITAPNGCDTTISARLGVGTRPTFNVLKRDTAMCAGGTFAIHVSDSTTIAYSWSPKNTGLSCDTCPNPIAKPNTTTKYYVRGRDPISLCERLDSVTITVNPMPVVNITKDTSICKGKNIQLLASGGTTYRWTPPGSGLDRYDIANPIASPTQKQTYIVRITNAAGCWRDTSVTVDVAPCGVKVQSPDVNLLSAMLACDTATTQFVISNTGEVAVKIDSVTVYQESNAIADKAYFQQQNTLLLPTTMQVGAASINFPVRIIPTALGQFFVKYAIHYNDTITIVTVSGTGVQRPVTMSLSSTSVGVDSTFAYPVIVKSNYWSELRIREVIAGIRYTPNTMILDTSRKILSGEILDATWNVVFDKSTSSDGYAEFHATGITPITKDGILFTPYFTSLLANDFSSLAKIDFSFPQFRLDCTEEHDEEGSVQIVTCAATIRRVRMTSNQFALVSVTPNPVNHAQELAITYSLGTPCDAEIRLYDQSGKEVSQVVYGKHAEGLYVATFDATNIASGTYYCTMSAAGLHFSKQVVVVK